MLYVEVFFFWWDLTRRFWTVRPSRNCSAIIIVIIIIIIIIIIVIMIMIIIIIIIIIIMIIKSTFIEKTKLEF